MLHEPLYVPSIADWIDLTECSLDELQTLIDCQVVTVH